MTTSMVGECKSCKYWKSMGKVPKPEEAAGECHRYPPQITTIPGSHSTVVTRFPLTIESNVCGEWAQKP